MRCCPATPPTRRRCGVFSSGSSGITVRRVGWSRGCGPETTPKRPRWGVFLGGSGGNKGRAGGFGVRDRGGPTGGVLAEMRAPAPPVHYLVGTPKGRLTRLEKHLVAKPW